MYNLLYKKTKRSKRKKTINSKKKNHFGTSLQKNKIKINNLDIHSVRY
jgi:hypothetical protein